MDPNHNPDCMYQGRCNSYKCLMCNPGNAKYVKMMDEATKPAKMDMTDKAVYVGTSLLGFYLFILFEPMLTRLMYWQMAWDMHTGNFLKKKDEKDKK